MAGVRKGLTIRQQKYCEGRADGKTMPEAYLAAGYACTEKNKPYLKSNAYNLEYNKACSPLIRDEIARLRKIAEEGAILDRLQRQAMLTEIALDQEEKTDNRLRSLDMLNRMSGDYTDNIRSESITKVQLSYAEKKALLEAELRGEE